MVTRVTERAWSKTGTNNLHIMVSKWQGGTAYHVSQYVGTL